MELIVFALMFSVIRKEVHVQKCKGLLFSCKTSVHAIRELCFCSTVWVVPAVAVCQNLVVLKNIGLPSCVQIAL